MKSFIAALLSLVLLSGFTPWKPPADLQPDLNAAGVCPDGRYLERVGFQRDAFADKYEMVAYYLDGVPLMVFSVSVDGKFTRLVVYLPDGTTEVFSSVPELAAKYPSPCDVVSPQPEKPA
jgi:hypothetical protein